MRPAATIGVDVDPVDLHLQGYGHRGLAPDPRVYTVALPRLMRAFERAGVRATWFVVGRDAAAQAAALAALVAGGHEVASHSLTHPMGLVGLPADALRREVEDSRRALAQVCGAEVIGFRAPNFDVAPHVLESLAQAGYRYDASDYPSPFLLPARLLLALKSRVPRAVLGLRLWPHSFERLPHRVAAGRLVEFPTAVTPWLRYPVYHTLRFFTRPARFRGMLEGFARRGEPLSYALHAVDALGLIEDGVDPRLASHPGMRVPLADKLALLDETLQAIARAFEPLPFRDRLVRGEVG